MNIERIVKEIKAGNLVVTPTDTVYGVMADATNAAAVERVYQAKQRPHNKSLILLMSDVEMLREYVKDLSPLETEIIEKYLPAKLTLLLQKSAGKIADNTTDGNLIGVRIPDNTALCEIIRQVGNPVVSTSANLSGEVTVTDPKMLNPEVLRYISYVEDAGVIESDPSAIIKVVDEKIEVVRDGEIAQNYRRTLAKYGA